MPIPFGTRGTFSTGGGSMSSGGSDVLWEFVRLIEKVPMKE